MKNRILVQGEVVPTNTDSEVSLLCAYILTDIEHSPGSLVDHASRRHYKTLVD